MFHAEIVSHTVLDPRYHTYVEQITGKNSATVVQNGKRPRGEMALPLAYFKALQYPNSDTSDVNYLLGFLQFGLLVGGDVYEMDIVLGWPHGLRVLSSDHTRTGQVGVLFAGDGGEWWTELRNAGVSDSHEVKAWGRACHAQFAKHNLDDLIGKIRPGTNEQYLLE